MEKKFICAKCGKNHATWEHRIYEKIKLAEMGVPLERLFIILPDELEREVTNEPDK